VHYFAASSYRAMLLGDNQPFTPAELTAHADAAVQAFLAAYRS
jgi:hypothetical protein